MGCIKYWFCMLIYHFQNWLNYIRIVQFISSSWKRVLHKNSMWKYFWWILHSYSYYGVNDNFIPSSSDVLRKVIVEQISNMMVLPNKFPVVLSETIPAQTIKTPEPEVIVLAFDFSCNSKMCTFWIVSGYWIFHCWEFILL